jgi:hypothetical protein
MSEGKYREGRIRELETELGRLRGENDRLRDERRLFASAIVLAGTIGERVRGSGFLLEVELRGSIFEAVKAADLLIEELQKEKP